MKNKKGFTLIEMLAVVVILGLLTIVAVNSVSKSIDKSKRSGYIDSAKEFIQVAAQGVARGDFVIRQTDTTYYINYKNLPLEKNTDTSPYGKWVDAYVAVTVDAGNNYKYYWTSVDTAGYYVPLTEQGDLDIDSIIVIGDKKVDSNHPIDGRNKIIKYNDAGIRVEEPAS